MITSHENRELNEFEITQPYHRSPIAECDNPVMMYCVTKSSVQVNINKMASSFFCLVLLLTVKSAFSARVAGLAAFSTGSHYFVVRKVLEELASRGHEVT